ncbi:MAG: outer rane assembly lipoprotein YfiO [Bacteroidetes bacterium]|jgi:outer membrane protein assembly factor BamD|nr:outer rane assembly lipoprotein YfiO [Bacteroidota bacterium]
MTKKHFFISLFAILLIAMFACNSEKKIYYSDGGTEKVRESDDSISKFRLAFRKIGRVFKKDENREKRFSLTIGRYNKIVKRGTLDQKYAAAIKYFEKEDYSKALTLFEELMSIYKGTSKGEEVHYYYAYSNYNVEDYLVAGYQFRNYARIYPGGKHAEECAYMNAYCFYLNSPEYSLDQIDTKLAIKEFQAFVNRYPQSERIPKCNELIDQLRAKLERKSSEIAMQYFNMNDYKAGINSFQNHNRDFPGNKHEEEFNYLIVKGYYLLALNSIESKKQERFKAAIDSYTKFAETFPKSPYLKDAEFYQKSALKSLEKYNKSTS